jgi:hypothetical protein
MRVVDELDADTAKLFERRCGSHIGGWAVPKCLAGTLPFPELLQLVSAGL